MDSAMTREEWDRQKDVYRGISSDMSPAAVARRIQIASDLNQLARSLSGIGRITPQAPGESEEEFLGRIQQAIGKLAPGRFTTDEERCKANLDSDLLKHPSELESACRPPTRPGRHGGHPSTGSQGH